MSDHGVHLIKMPSGARLFFDDSLDAANEPKHDYYRAREAKKKKDGSGYLAKDADNVDGWCRSTRLTGVTTAAKALDIDPSRLLNWAAKTQCIGVADLASAILNSTGPEDLLDALSWLETQESIWDALEESELTFENVRDRAGVEGTNVHMTVFHALATGAAVPDFDSLSERERGLGQAVVAAWLDHDPDPKLAEQVVYSEKLGVAGRLDFFGRLRSRCANEACPCHEIDLRQAGVMDLKTGNYLGAAAHAQVGGGYPRLLSDSGFGEAKWALFLKVHDDGTYDLVRAHGTPEGFEGAVSTYREAARIMNADRKDYERRQKAREAVPA